MNKKHLWLLTLLALAALIATGCRPAAPEEEEASPEEGTVDDPSTPWIEMTPEEMGCQYGEDGKCRVVLSNSFIGRTSSTTPIYSVSSGE